MTFTFKSLLTISISATAQQLVTLVTILAMISNFTLALSWLVTEAMFVVTASGTDWCLTHDTIPARSAHNLSLLGAHKSGVVLGFGIQT